MRGFVFGFVVMVGMSLTILSMRPGGLRRQLRVVARRFRIVLVLSGAWAFGSMGIRLAFATGPVADYGPVALAILLGAVFMFVGRDPVTTNSSSLPRPPN